MISFLNLKNINAPYRQEFDEAFRRILNKGQFILSEQVAQFEENFAKYCGTKHCIGTGNGLDALFLIFKAYIELGILKKDDEILVPANTFIASILPIINNNLKPIFVEPNASTFNISTEDIQSKITSKSKAILVVHLYGQLADMDAINKIANDYDLLVIEDAAQADGAKNDLLNKKAGNLGNAAAFSFYPAKNLGALGDGGAITTNNEALNHRIKLLRNYGSEKKYYYKTLGFNSRLDELQACFLNIKLKYLDQKNEKRRQIAKRYLSKIKNRKIELPYYDDSLNHVFYTFVIKTNTRNELMSYLNNHKIGWLIYYPVPAHQQEAMSHYQHLNLPITEKLSQRIISLPLHPELKEEDVSFIIEKLNNF